jgi:hypothetical protein
MELRAKLVWLELVGGIFGWVWIVASVTALYCLVVAIFLDSPWSRFFWAFGIGIIAKWLAKGFRDNQLRVAFVAELMEKGLSREEASRERFERYTQKKT